MKHLSRFPLSRTLTAGLGLCALSLPWLAASGQAQVVFSQDFSGSDYSASTASTGNPAGPNQFNDIIAGTDNNPSVVNGTLQFVKTGSGGAGATRNTPIPGLSNTAASFQFNFSVSGVTAGSTSSNDLFFLVGSGFGDNASKETNTCQQYNINLLGGNTFSVFTANGITSPTFSGLQTITLDLNKTASTVNFAIPGGGTLALAPNNFALYVDNMNVLTPFGADQLAIGYGGTGNAAYDITNFKLRYQASGDNGTVTADNFVITVVPEPSTYALLGVGLAGLGAVAARRRRVVC